MNRHERRALAAQSSTRAVMNVACRPFEAPEPFSEMSKDARRAYVAILCAVAQKMQHAGSPPVWRMAASFHELIQKGLVALEFDGRQYKIVLAPDLKYDWIN